MGVPYTVTVTLFVERRQHELTYSSIGYDATFTGSGSTQTLTPNAVGGPFDFEPRVQWLRDCDLSLLDRFGVDGAVEGNVDRRGRGAHLRAEDDGRGVLLGLQLLR